MIILDLTRMLNTDNYMDDDKYLNNLMMILMNNNKNDYLMFEQLDNKRIHFENFFDELIENLMKDSFVVLIKINL